MQQYLLAKIWYVTQISPPHPTDAIRRINTAIAWFIWNGEIFRVPLSTLQRGKNDGGWNMYNAEAKCRALFMYRLQKQSQQKGTITADWLKHWNLNIKPGNPQYPVGITEKMGYLRTYATDAAYIPEQWRTETPKVYKKRIYETLKALAIAITPSMPMRAEKQCPEAEWTTIWKNLALTPTTGEDKANWYKVIHDIIPTNERLHRIRIAPTDLCFECNQKDTLIHRMIECGENAANWKRIQNHIARMLRVAPKNIPHDWLIRPQMKLWPPQRQRAVLWLLARYVSFTIERRRSQNPIELMDFLKRSRWKLYQSSHRKKQVANFLMVLDMPQ